MEIVNESNVFMNQSFETQADIFTFLSEKATELSLASESSPVLEALKKRESEGTTGMMDGFAIPHAKSAEIIKPGVIIMKLSAGVEWDSLDGNPITFVIALFIPESQAGTTHIQLLSQIARMLMKEDFKSEINAQNSVAGIVSVLNQRLNP